MDRLIAIRNRPGRFAVVDPTAAAKLADGLMKLYQDAEGQVLVETVTRTRFALAKFDPGHRVIFVAVDENGNLVTETD